MPVRTNVISYEELTAITNAFEEHGINQGRDWIVALSIDPLLTIDQLLDSSDNTLGSITSNTVDLPDNNETNRNPTPPLELANLDADLLELLGDVTGPEIEAWLRECQPCQGRVQFRWQVQPGFVLDPIARLLSRLEASVDRFRLRFEDRGLEGLCRAVNAFRRICIPDIIQILLSLKLLLKRYTQDTFKIKLDWTVVVGPVLKFIVDAVSNLMVNIQSVIAGGMSCALAQLQTADALDREARALAGQVLNTTRDIASTVEELASGRLPGNYELDVLMGNVQVESGRAGNYPVPPTTPRLDTTVLPADEINQDQNNFFRGLELTGQLDLSQQFSEPDWLNKTFLSKIIAAVEDAKNYIDKLINNVSSSLNSLEGLVGGGVSVQLDRFGLLMFLMDTIGFIMTIIRLISQNRNVTDWCDFMERNPDAVASSLSQWLGEVEVASEAGALFIRQGDYRMGNIQTCSSEPARVNNELISSWLRDLEDRA